MSRQEQALRNRPGRFPAAGHRGPPRGHREATARHGPPGGAAGSRGAQGRVRAPPRGTADSGAESLAPVGDRSSACAAKPASTVRGIYFRPAPRKPYPPSLHMADTPFITDMSVDKPLLHARLRLLQSPARPGLNGTLTRVGALAHRVQPWCSPPRKGTLRRRRSRAAAQPVPVRSAQQSPISLAVPAT